MGSIPYVTLRQREVLETPLCPLCTRPRAASASGTLCSTSFQRLSLFMSLKGKIGKQSATSECIVSFLISQAL